MDNSTISTLMPPPPSPINLDDIDMEDSGPSESSTCAYNTLSSLAQRSHSRPLTVSPSRNRLGEDVIEATECLN
ncbi:hypothetical protein GJ744_003384 [Endocarpon pusillum]|uniref:Uncharacterized protein n=1 Tax=Endocarpon pusillum TaxID=364733 RepID=A0A8H7A6R3_9EURO|nr:hypothetical protein GJ744_003384 [Endocarpon pusillum]